MSVSRSHAARTSFGDKSVLTTLSFGTCFVSITHTSDDGEGATKVRPVDTFEWPIRNGSQMLGLWEGVGV